MSFDKCPSPEAIPRVPRMHNFVDEVAVVVVNSINARRVRYRRPTQADAEPRPTERVRGGTGRRIERSRRQPVAGIRRTDADDGVLPFRVRWRRSSETVETRCLPARKRR